MRFVRASDVNPFAVLGLSALTPIEAVWRRAEELVVEAELAGEDAGPAKRAVQELEDATRRLLHEILWLYRNDAQAIRALQSGSVAAITAAYEAAIDRLPSASFIDVHDAAVLAHAQAVSAASAGDEQCEALWRRAFARWQQILAGGALDSWLRERAAALNDPRLTPTYLRELREAVARQLLEGLVLRATADAAAGRVTACRRWLHLIATLDSTAPAASRAARQRIEDAALQVVIDACEQGALHLQQEKITPAAVTEAGTCLERARLALAKVDQITESPSTAVTEAHDRVANLAFFLSSRVNDQLQQFERAAQLIETALSTAHSPSLRHQLEQVLAIARRNACGQLFTWAVQATEAGQFGQAVQYLTRARYYADEIEQHRAIGDFESMLVAGLDPWILDAWEADRDERSGW